MIKEFIILFSIGLVLGGLLSRMIYRFSVGANIFNFRINLSTATDRKFRLVELIPIFGAVLTHIKHHKRNENVALGSIVVEILTGLSFYLIVALIQHTVFVIMMVVWSMLFIAYIYFNIIHKEYELEMLEEQLSVERDKKENKLFMPRNSNRMVRASMAHLKKQ